MFCFQLLFGVLLLPGSVQELGGNWEMLQIFGSTNQGDKFGQDIDFIEDLNSDGHPDIVIGAPNEDPGGLPYAGAIYFYSGYDGIIIQKVSSSQPRAAFGNSISTLEDLNSDSCSDVIVGAVEMGDLGYAFVISGNDGSMIYQHAGPSLESNFGGAVDRAGDINADGFEDYLVGAILAEPNGLFNAGSTFVYSGKDGSLLYQKDGAFAGAWHGRAVSGAGDTNGDGYDDFLVSDFNAGNTGSVHLYSGIDGSLRYQIDGYRPQDFFGSALDELGDIDGDGLSDFVVGADEATISGGPVDAGAAYVYSGATGSLLFEWHGSNIDEEFGYAVRRLSDLNGDGFVEIGVGAPCKWNEFFEELGATYIYSGIDGSLIALLWGENDGDSFGNAIADVEDLNDDNRSELLVGAFTESPGGTARIYSFDPFLTPSATSISAANGGTITYAHDFPDTEAGLLYILLASTNDAGSVEFGGLSIPLTNSNILQKMIYNPPPVFVGQTGTLNATGQACTVVTFPPGAATAFVGQTIALASVSLNSPSQPSLSSARVLLQVEP